MFWTLFGRTELILGASKAKYCEELDFEVRFHVAPWNPDKNTKKRISETGKYPKQISGVENKLSQRNTH